MIIVNRNGITVRELKYLINQLPDYDEYGEESEVWLETGQGLTSPAKTISTLNRFDIFLSTQEE